MFVTLKRAQVTNAVSSGKSENLNQSAGLNEYLVRGIE